MKPPAEVKPVKKGFTVHFPYVALKKVIHSTPRKEKTQMELFNEEIMLARTKIIAKKNPFASEFRHAALKKIKFSYYNCFHNTFHNFNIF